MASETRDQIESGKPIYLTAVQLARQLHVDDKTVYRWGEQEPSMPVLRIKGVVRFPRASVFSADWPITSKVRPAVGARTSLVSGSSPVSPRYLTNECSLNPFVG